MFAGEAHAQHARVQHDALQQMYLDMFVDLTKCEVGAYMTKNSETGPAGCPNSWIWHSLIGTERLDLDMHFGYFSNATAPR